jgi:hypothetical protein
VTVMRPLTWAGSALALLLVFAAPVRAEWQLRPFLGLTFAGKTTLIGADDLQTAVGRKNLALGIAGGYLGEVFGVEVDIARAPGFFEANETATKNITRSNVTTVTGSVVVALPRRMTEYTLRPYFVGGAGLMRLAMTDTLGAFAPIRNMPAFDLGGGATGFLSRSIGLNWDLRHFRNFNGQVPAGTAGEAEALSFWRATMALAVRY